MADEASHVPPMERQRSKREERRAQRRHQLSTDIEEAEKKVEKKIARAKSKSRSSISKPVKHQIIVEADPTPWYPQTVIEWIRLILLVPIAALPVIAFVLTFSEVGYGEEVHVYLKERAAFSNVFLGGSLFLGCILYIFDVSYWEGFMRHTRHVVFILMGVGIFLGTLFAADEYPSAPMCLFVLGAPIFYVFVRKSLFWHVRNVKFYGSMAVALIFSGFITISIFIYWVNLPDEDNFWPGENNTLRHEYNIIMDCHTGDNACRVHNVTTTNGTVVDCAYFADEDLVAPYDECCINYACLAAYLLWFSPFISGFISLVFGVLAFFLARNEGTNQVVHPAIRVFGITIMCTLLGVWVAASVASTQAGLSNAILMFSFCGLGLMTGFIVSAVGWSHLKDVVFSIPLIRRIMESVFSDWARALFLMVCTPFFGIYLFISTINQLIRRCTPCSKDLDEDEKKFWLTLVSHHQVEVMRKWKWSSVLVKVMYWGYFFLVVSVGIAKATTLFLSWLNEQLSGQSLGFITCVFSGVGLFMFLLPPVPGVPVYVTGGVVLVKAAWAQWDFWTGLVYTGFVCFLIKLTAIFCQQKGIGERMSGNVKIRYMVGTNSITIQAIRLILERPGLSIDKVSILCGGPDWPTSVLTGILRLSVVKMLIASGPVIFLIFPCVAAGAFQLRKSEGGVWGSLASVTLLLATLVQTIALVAAAYFIEKAATSSHDELVARCNDKEVAALEKRDKVKHERYLVVTDWHAPTFPTWMKVNLVVGALLIGISCWTIQLFGTRCFAVYEITDTIDGKLDGKASNLVLTWGRYAMGAAALATVNLIIFNKWAARMAKAAENTELGKVKETTEL